MINIDPCDTMRNNLIAAAIGLQQCTKTESNIVPIQGGDRVIVIGTPAQVAQLLELPVPAGADVIAFGASLLGHASETDCLDEEEARAWVRERWLEWPGRAASQPPAPVAAAERPDGAIHNAAAYANMLENIYDFECEAGPLRHCYEWIELRRCLNVLADYVDASPAAAPDAAHAQQDAAPAEIVGWYLKGPLGNCYAHKQCGPEWLPAYSAPVAVAPSDATGKADAASAGEVATLLQAAGAMRWVRCHDGSGEPFAAYDKDIADRVVAGLRAEMHAMTAATSAADAKDAQRLDFLAYHSASLHIDPEDGRCFLVAPYHTGISCIDDHKRFDTTREAIDAAIAAAQPDGPVAKGEQSDLTTIQCPACVALPGLGCDECHGQGRVIVSRADLAEMQAEYREALEMCVKALEHAGLGKATREAALAAAQAVLAAPVAPSQTQTTLTPEELAFVELVRQRPGHKLNGGEALASDGRALWERPEQLGLIQAVGSYKWVAPGAAPQNPVVEAVDGTPVDSEGGHHD